MDQLAPVSWIPSGLFALLACFFLQKAIRPEARRTWGWGRVGGQVPVSRLGYAVWGVTFLLVAAILAFPQRPPLILIVLLVGCILAIVGVGVRDTWIYRRSLSRQSGRSDR